MPDEISGGVVFDSNWYKAIVDVIREAVIVIDSEGKVIYWNDSAETMFGYTKDEMLGQQLSKVMPDKFRGQHASSMMKAADDHIDHNHNVIGKTVELAGLHRTAGEFPIELSISERKVGDKFYFIGVIRDITSRKKIENSLKEKMSDVEKINNLLVDRELKMIELKKQLEGKG